MTERVQQQCGHPVNCIVGSDEGTNYCLRCALEAAYESHQNWLEALAAYEAACVKSDTKGRTTQNRRTDETGTARQS